MAPTKQGQNKGTKNATDGISIETVRLAAVVGETYPVRQQLKNAGGVWAPGIGAWTFGSVDKAERALPKNAKGVSVDEVKVTALVGETYPFRQLLKALGGSWEPAARAWVFESEQKAARALGVISTQ